MLVIEGIDGTGKTTLAARLAERIRRTGRSVALLREPTDGPYGRRIRSLAKEGRQDILPEEELELFIQDRIQNCRENIQPALERGECVVLDRYYLSTVAYQGALGLDPQMILERNEKIAIIPDLVLLLDTPVQDGLSRIAASRPAGPDLFENRLYLERVRSIFLGIKRPFIRVLDATRDRDSVFRSAWAVVRQNLENRHQPAPEKPVKKDE
ncbi:dTMP kinase [bacterium]|nr:dTMP kinase [bacterium]